MMYVYDWHLRPYVERANPRKIQPCRSLSYSGRAVFITKLLINSWNWYRGHLKTSGHANAMSRWQMTRPCGLRTGAPHHARTYGTLAGNDNTEIGSMAIIDFYTFVPLTAETRKFAFYQPGTEAASRCKA